MVLSSSEQSFCRHISLSAKPNRGDLDWHQSAFYANFSYIEERYKLVCLVMHE
jgi:hypothetical protein